MTEKEFAGTISPSAKQDFEKVDNGEMTLLEMAEKYNMTFRKGGNTYVKATLMNAFTAWKNHH